MGFLELSRRMSVINRGMLVEMIEEILNEMETDIVKMNQEQLQEGMYSDGGLLPPYSYKTTEMNPKKQGRIKLFDTGDFYQSIFATAGMGILEVDAKDWKTEMLKEEYGELILGVHPMNMNELIRRIAEKLKIRVGIYLSQR